MGRVAKYKKVKSFDPYSKKNGGKVDLPNVGVWGLGDNGRKVRKRSQKAERMHAKKVKNQAESKSNKKKNNSNKFADDGGFDVPPMEEDEFDMADLMGSIKKQKVETKDLLGATDNAASVASNDKATSNNSNTMDESYDKIVTSTGNVANIPKTEQDENKVARLLRLDKQEEQKAEKERKLSHNRMEGESKRAYAKRTRAETRQIIKQSTTTNRNLEKLQKKKEFMNNKKKQKKRKGAYSSSYGDADGGDGYDDGYDSDTYKGRGRGGDSPEAPVRFGEQAERPPVFRQIPRGAKSKSKTVTLSAKSQGMSEDQVAAEKNAMEVMRRRVQAQYKAIKTRRKEAGDFHL